MDESTKVKLRASLYETLVKWWDKEAGGVLTDFLPWLGDNTIQMIADTACNVIFAIADTQAYLKDQGYLKDR